MLTVKRNCTRAYLHLLDCCDQMFENILALHYKAFRKKYQLKRKMKQNCEISSLIHIATRCLDVKPGSHMPLTYLGQRCGICEHLSPTHNLSQASTAGLPAKLSWVQLRWQAGGCRRWNTLCEHHLRQRTPVRRLVENCAIWFAFLANLSTLAIHHRCAWDTGRDRRTLTVATGDYVASRSAGYENQALLYVFVFSQQIVFQI